MSHVLSKLNNYFYFYFFIGKRKFYYKIKTPLCAQGLHNEGGIITTKKKERMRDVKRLQRTRVVLVNPHTQAHSNKEDTKAPFS